jgi:hypothetical protein
MQLQSFGYFGIRSQKLEDWAEYGPKFLGLEVVERTPTTLKLRMDDRKQRILVSSTDADVTAFGFEVADAAALDALAARLEGQQVPVRRVPSADAAPSVFPTRSAIRSRPSTAPKRAASPSSRAGPCRASAPVCSAWATPSCT